MQVRDPHGVFFVSSPTVFSKATPVENSEVVTNIVQKLAALLEPFRNAHAMQAQALLQRAETEAAARSSVDCCLLRREKYQLPKAQKLNRYLTSQAA